MTTNEDHIYRLLVDLTDGSYVELANHYIEGFKLGTFQGACYKYGKVWLSINRTNKGIVFVGIQLSYTDASYMITDGYGFERYNGTTFEWAECEGM